MVLDGHAGHRGRRRGGDGDEALRAGSRETAPTSCSWTCGCRGMDGVEATRRIVATARTRAKVLILTTFDLDEYAFAGAAGRRLRIPAQGRPAGELLAAIRAVHAATRSSRRPPPAACWTAFAARCPSAGGRPSPSLAADRPRARGLSLDRQGLSNARDRGPAVPVRGDGENPRRPHPGQAGAARPRPGRDLAYEHGLTHPR